MKKENKLLDGFFRPHHDYRPATMWYWNDDMLESEITTQMEAFAEKGVNDFFVNATWGATYDYLSDHYFELIKHAVKEAKRLNLNFWIYDEFNWPSGIAGGKLLEEHPETRGAVIKDNKWMLDHGNDIYSQYVKGKFEGAYVIVMGNNEDCGIDVSDKVKIEENEKGFWVSYKNEFSATVSLHVMASYLQETITPAALWGRYSTNTEGYVDALDKDAMRAFIDSTHEKYKAAVGEEFGKTIKGIFTDEVCVGEPFDMGLSRVPWNKNIKEQFKARYGYDMTPWLYAIVEKPRNAQEKKVRYDYWWLTTELVRDAHIKQVYEWCDDENLIYTGHFDGEESLVWSMYQSGDHFELMKWMHIPGIDSIVSRTRINDEEFNMAGKLLSSCARFFDRDRTLCETYTISSHKLRFDEMRRIANRLTLLGVNMIQYMGSSYSLNNGRRYPGALGNGPGHNYFDPLFLRYDLYGDYLARIQYVSAQTRPAGRVLVMWPQAGVYVNLDGHMQIFNHYDDKHVGYYERTVMGLMNTLLDINVEYDVFGDCLVNEVKAANGVASFYGNEYDTVIIPDTGDTTSAVVEMIERLKAAGVKMVFVDELPQLMVDKAEYTAPLGKAPEADGITTIGENIEFMRLSTDDKRRGKNELFKKLLLKVLGEDSRTLDIRHDGDIYTGLRYGENTSVVFMCNDAAEERHASIAYRPTMQLLDPDTGLKCELCPKAGRADIHFDPYQMYILIEENEAIELPIEQEAGEQVVALRPSCDLKAEGGNILVAVWNHAPYEDNGQPIVVPEDKLVPIPDYNVPGKYTGINAQGLIIYDFDVEIIPESVKLFVESGSVLRCELNGQRIDDKWSDCLLWGPHGANIEVAPLLNKGKNRIALIFQMPDYNTPYMVPFVMLRGDFETNGNAICAKRASYLADPVNKQGYSSFYGEMKYIFKAELTKDEAAQTAFINVETRDAAELFVNGKSAGVRLWAPQRFNVEGMLKAGENEITVKSTIPMWNLFRMTAEQMDSGLVGAPVLEKKK